MVLQSAFDDQTICYLITHFDFDGYASDMFDI